MPGTRENPPQRETAAKSWASYLNARLARLRWSQADLIRAAGLDGDGNAVLSTSRVSLWCSGQQAARPDKAVVVAEAMGDDPAEALDAILETRLAQAMRRERGHSVADPANRSVLREDLAALYATDLPDHLKQKFEHEYMEFVEPMVHGSEAARRKFHAEVKEAIRDQEEHGSRGATG